MRSAHPQTSFAALGPHAAGLLAGHAPDCRLGERSPLARLEETGARVLLLGAGYDACTAVRLAEYRVPAPRVRVGRPAPGGGWETVTEVSITSDRFEELGHDFERDRPVVVRGRARRTYACSPWPTRWPTPNGGCPCTGPARRGSSPPPARCPGSVPRLGAHAE